MRHLNEVQRQEILHRRRNGETLQAIAERFNRTVPAIWYLCERAKLGVRGNYQSPRYKDRQRERRNREIMRLRAKGKSLSYIGARFGITRQRVSQICKEIEGSQ